MQKNIQNKINRIFKKFVQTVVSNLLILTHAFARGGGGGSGGGGGGGGGGSSSGSSGSGGGNTNPFVIIFIILFFVVISWFSYVIAAKKRKEKIEKAEQELKQAESKDSAWDDEAIKKRAGEVFYSFQKDWSNFDIESMEKYLTNNYHKRMVLEMNVIKNEKRQNIVDSPKIISLNFMEIDDNDTSSADKFTVEIVAKAQDKLIDTESSKVLYQDNSRFTEYWTFCREDNNWKLDIIRQSTEDKSSIVSQIVEFSKRNNFFYDPDFGWLMMPNKGALFSKSNFMSTDINNHVIGFYREKIVEFYSFQTNAKQDNPGPVYIIAQAILPISYRDILVKRREFLNLAPRGLREHSMESVDFNKKFIVYSDPQDNVSSFELLAPDFMEKIYALPFKMNIEIVGNFLYFYTRDKKVSYDQMLEVISWAFDEMKL